METGWEFEAGHVLCCVGTSVLRGRREGIDSEMSGWDFDRGHSRRSGRGSNHCMLGFPKTCRLKVNIKVYIAGWEVVKTVYVGV